MNGETTPPSMATSSTRASTCVIGARRNSLSAAAHRSCLWLSEAKPKMKILSRSITCDLPDSQSSSGQTTPAACGGVGGRPVDYQFVQKYIKKETHIRQNSDPTADAKSGSRSASQTPPSSSYYNHNNNNNNNNNNNTKLVASRMDVGQQQRPPVRRASSGLDIRQTVPSDEQQTQQQAGTRFKVLESLYLGVPCAEDDRLFCSMKIDRLIDLRLIGGGGGGSVQQCSNGCACLTGQHPQFRIGLPLGNRTQPAELIRTFRRINQLINEWRLQGKKSLLFGQDCQQASVAAIQYLMSYYQIRLCAAQQLVARLIPDQRLDKVYQDTLLDWERQLFSGSSEQNSSSVAGPFCPIRSSSSDTQLPKAANVPKKHLAWT